jgi:ubiquinone/menaquinone biosynthesis C-methylase UbiE
MTEQALHFNDSAAYERLMGRWSRAVAPIFLDWLDSPSDARWLEIGCGTGIFTEVLLDRGSPAAVSAIDPSKEQIEYARSQPAAQRADFQVADAQTLPFPDCSFDIVVSALVINFIPDRPRALSEMRRVSRVGGIVAGYIWDFAPELSPSGPMRRGMRRFGMAIPDLPGTHESDLGALISMFERAGFEEIATTSIDITVSFADFESFWQAQTPSYAPTTKMIAAMPGADRERLIATVRAGLPLSADGRIEYSARANAIKARVPQLR